MCPRWLIALCLACCASHSLPASTFWQRLLDADAPLTFDPEGDWLASQAENLREQLDRLPTPPISQQSERIGWHSNFATDANTTKWLQVDLGESQPFDSVILVPVDVAYGEHPGPGFGFPVRFRVEVSDDATFSAPRLLAALDSADYVNPGNVPVYLPTHGAVGRFVRVTATRLWPRGDRALMALGEVFVWKDQRNLAAFAPVTVSDSYDNPPAWQPSNATDGQTVLGAPVIIEPAPGNGWHARTEKTQDLTKWVQVDLGEERVLDEVRLYPARPKDFPARRGFGFPVRFRVEAASEPEFTAPILLFDQTGADFENPAESPVLVPAKGTRARYVRVTATKLWARTNDFIFAFAELEAWSGGENVARGREVMSLEGIKAASWSPPFLVDGYNSQGRIVGYPAWLEQLSRRRHTAGQLQHMQEKQAQWIVQRRHAFIRSAATAAAVLSVPLVWWLIQRARRRRREVEELRQRIAGDLHDEIGSNLGSIALLSQMALREPSHSQADLTEINRVAQETASSMRDLVWFIKPAALTEGDFVAKLRETAASMLVGLEWTFEGQVADASWSLDFKRQVFLIFKEALHNIRRHAAATRVCIQVGEKDGAVVLEIADNGQGFDPHDKATGHGLESMRQRAATLGGKLEITSTRGEGARLNLRAPLARRGLSV